MKSYMIAVLAFILIGASSAWGQSTEEAAARAAEQAGKLQEALAHYTMALQATISDSEAEQRLSKSIIALVKRMSPSPATPEDAKRYMARGAAAVEIANTQEDFGRAAAEFKKAIRVAPWLANAYYNLGVVQEKASLFEAAMRSYKLYLLSTPSEREAKEIQQRIFGLEYKAERQREQRQRDPQQRAAQEDAAKSQVSLAGYWRDMAGSRYLLQIDGNHYTIIRVMACWRLPSEYWGRCPDLRPDNTLYHHGTIAAGVVTGFSVNTMNHNTGTCSVPAGNYPITQSELTTDGKQLTITATNPNCPLSSFLLGPRVYRRDD